MSEKTINHKTAKKNKVILLLDTNKGYRRELIGGISKYFNLHGLWDIHLSGPSRKSEKIELLKKWKPDGLISEYYDYEDFKKCLSLNIPVVALGIQDLEGKNIGGIIPNNFRMGKIAAEYYLEKGFKSYAFCGYESSDSGNETLWSRERFEGFLAPLETSGFNVPVYESRYTQGIRLEEKELIGIGDWLKKMPRPIAVFACNDVRGGDVVKACHLVGLKIPDEVAVLGVGNDEFRCNFFNPPLSSIVLAAEQAGYQAAELLDKMVCGQEIDSNRITIHPKYIVERQSTNVSPIEDEDVAMAIAYIQRNCMKPLCPSDVAEAVCMSYRTLRRRFQKIRGWPIHKEITRIRMDRVCKLLAETDLTITEIANKMEFSDPRNLSRDFKREMGISPLPYRKKMKILNADFPFRSGIENS